MKRWKIEVPALFLVSAGLLAYIFRNWVCGCGRGYHTCCVDRTGDCWTRMLGIGMFSALIVAVGAATLVLATRKRFLFRGLRTCRNCGRTLEPAWSVCPYCGK